MARTESHQTKSARSSCQPGAFDGFDEPRSLTFNPYTKPSICPVIRLDKQERFRSSDPPEATVTPITIRPLMWKAG
jgi:hypothetical protein